MLRRRARDLLRGAQRVAQRALAHAGAEHQLARLVRRLLRRALRRLQLRQPRLRLLTRQAAGLGGRAERLARRGIVRFELSTRVDLSLDGALLRGELRLQQLLALGRRLLDRRPRDQRRLVRRARVDQLPIEMARLFDTGDGGRLPSHTEAFRLHRRAAELGNVPAMVEVGIAYEAGRGVGVDKRKACRAYGLAADRGDVIGMCRLARCYTLGPGDGVDDVDYAAAARLYQRAADLGFVNAVACLEDLRAKGRIPGDPAAKKAPPAPPPPGATPGEPPRTTF